MRVTSNALQYVDCWHRSPAKYCAHSHETTRLDQLPRASAQTARPVCPTRAAAQTVRPDDQSSSFAIDQPCEPACNTVMLRPTLVADWGELQKVLGQTFTSRFRDVSFSGAGVHTVDACCLNFRSRAVHPRGSRVRSTTAVDLPRQLSGIRCCIKQWCSSIFKDLYCPHVYDTELY